MECVCVDDENFAPWLLTAPALFEESFEEFLIVGSVNSILVSLNLLKLILEKLVGGTELEYCFQ